MLSGSSTEAQSTIKKDVVTQGASKSNPIKCLQKNQWLNITSTVPNFSKQCLLVAGCYWLVKKSGQVRGIVSKSPLIMLMALALSIPRLSPLLLSMVDLNLYQWRKLCHYLKAIAVRIGSSFFWMFSWK